MSLFGSSKMNILAPVTGEIIPLTDLNDEVFAAGMMGDGVGIIPYEGEFYSPIDGVVTAYPSTNHAIGITGDNDLEILIHVGMDTVNLNGKGFIPKVVKGQKVKAGDLLLVANLDVIKEEGYSINTPIVISNSDDYADVCGYLGEANAGDVIISVKPE